MKGNTEKNKCRLCHRESDSRYCTKCRSWGLIQDQHELLNLMEINPKISAKEVAQITSMSLDRVYSLAKRLGIKFHNPLINQPLRQYIIEHGSYTRGELSKMARKLGISRERIRQIAEQENLLPVCSICGELLPSRKLKYHSSCKRALWRGRILRLCIVCGNDLGKGQSLYCSPTCRKKSRKRKPIGHTQ